MTLVTVGGVSDQRIGWEMELFDDDAHGVQLQKGEQAAKHSFNTAVTASYPPPAMC